MSRVLATSGRAFSVVLFSAALACPDPTPRLEAWQCANDLEVSCAEGRCEASPDDAFTPMSAALDRSGEMSVCAYSGCWVGVGEVVKSAEFVVWIGHDLEFSTASEPGMGTESIVVALDRADGVATLKAGGFALPLLCAASEPAG